MGDLERAAQLQVTVQRELARIAAAAPRRSATPPSHAPAAFRAALRAALADRDPMLPVVAHGVAAAEVGSIGRAPSTYAAGGNVARVVQTDPAEYDSPAQAHTWGGSTCAAAALTSVLRAAGVPVRIAEVLTALGDGLTVQEGLVSRPSLVRAARAFGLGLHDDVRSYRDLVEATQRGAPALVDITSARFPEGHWLVVRRATEHGVDVVDSSGYDLRFIPRDEFLAQWRGRAMRVAPAPWSPAPARGAERNDS